MHTVIDGKNYSTGNSEHLAEWWNGKAVNDFNYHEEALYRKDTGEYFLHIKDGACKRYPDGLLGKGEVIRPVAFEEAQAWVERHSPEEYVNIFGEPSEGNEFLSIEISEEAKNKLKQFCCDHEFYTIQEVVEKLIIEKLPEIDERLKKLGA